MILEVRFWKKVDKTGDCWLWTASKRNGYGAFAVGAKTLYAHRVSYEMTRGPIPAGKVIDHLCGNRACVNPDHLEAVTQRTNVLRGDTIVRAHAEDRDCGSAGCSNCRRFAA